MASEGDTTAGNRAAAPAMVTARGREKGNGCVALCATKVDRPGPRVRFRIRVSDRGSVMPCHEPLAPWLAQIPSSMARPGL